MQFLTTGITAYLALLWFPFTTHAEINTSNRNLTIRFFQTSQDDTCSYTNTASALTFTTRSTPMVPKCLNLRDLFGGNTTSGFINQTSNMDPNIWIDNDVGIHYYVENTGKYNPYANYSSVLYRQHVTNPVDDRYAPGSNADRLVNIYGAENCSEVDPSSDRAFFDWYGFSCWSEDEGKCGTVGYGVKSINLAPGHEDDYEGQCWMFAKLGGAGRGYTGRKGMVGGIVVVVIAVWLAL